MDFKSKSNETITNRPLGLDKLTVELITSNNVPNDTTTSRVQYQGYMCRLDLVENAFQWCYYWAVVRVGHLFLFRNRQPDTTCHSEHLLSQYCFSGIEEKKGRPKGMLYCRLRYRNDSSLSMPQSGPDLDLGWSNAYQWERLLRDQVGPVEGKSSSAEEACRRRTKEASCAHRILMVALRNITDYSGSATTAAVNNSFESDVNSDEFFGEDGMPLPRKIPKAPLAGLFIGKPKANNYADSSVGSLSRAPVKQQPQQKQQQQQQAVYAEDDNIYDSATDSTSAAAAVKLEADNEYLSPDDLDQPVLPARRQLPTPQMTAPMANPLQKPAFKQALQQQVQLKQLGLAAASQANSKVSGMAEIVSDSQPAEASIRYFYRAYQNPAGQAQEAIANLNGKPRGTFTVLGYLTSKPRKVFSLYVQTGSQVAVYQVCEQNSGYRILPSDQSHGTMSQLLYHYHICDLPATDGQQESGLKLTRPVDGEEKFSFLCSAAWTLADRALCQKLLTGTPTGTFAVVSDVTASRFCLYVSRGGQVVKTQLETGQQGQIWAESHVKFASLEALLEHYHSQALIVSLVGGGQQEMGIKLVTPCQLSEQFAGNVKHYLDQQVEEETEELQGADSGIGGGGAVLVETRRLGPVSVRSESGSDLSHDPVPILQVDLTKKYKGPISVTQSQFRCFKEFYSLKRHPDIAFDSLDKLMLYVWSHPDKLR